MPIIEKSMEEYVKINNITNEKDLLNDIFFIDKYILEGYGCYNDDIISIINEMICKFGIPLDPVYTGKAYWGMQSYLKENKIEQNNILFIHTGGTPLFFDFLHKNKIRVGIGKE